MAFFFVNFPGVEFLGTAPKFGKRKKFFLSHVYVLQTMSHKELSRHGRARTAKKCANKHAARAKSVVLVDVAVVVLPVFINVCKRVGIRLYVFSINACESEYAQMSND